MNTLFPLLLSLGVLAFCSCSKPNEQSATTPAPASTPDAARLKSDSERLQQATNKAAEQRLKDEQQNPALNQRRPPKADLSPQTVPPQSPNPNP
jgi:hypothetical protein